MFLELIKGNIFTEDLVFGKELGEEDFFIFSRFPENGMVLPSYYDTAVEERILVMRIYFTGGKTEPLTIENSYLKNNFKFV
jgi:hypothetical protein